MRFNDKSYTVGRVPATLRESSLEFTGPDELAVVCRVMSALCGEDNPILAQMRELTVSETGDIVLWAHPSQWVYNELKRVAHRDLERPYHGIHRLSEEVVLAATSLYVSSLTPKPRGAHRRDRRDAPAIPRARSAEPRSKEVPGYA